MPDIQIFYCCACPECEQLGEEGHQIILPRKVDGLGEYTRLKTQLGVYEYGGPYIPAKNAWPAKFACLHCQACFPPQQVPEKPKAVDRDRLRHLVRSKRFVRIEIADEDEELYPQNRETFYTMARFDIPHERLVALAEKSCGYPRLVPQRVTIPLAISYEEFFVNDHAT
jgi:hypothetical protein